MRENNEMSQEEWNEWIREMVSKQIEREEQIMESRIAEMELQMPETLRHQVMHAMRKARTEKMRRRVRKAGSGVVKVAAAAALICLSLGGWMTASITMASRNKQYNAVKYVRNGYTDYRFFYRDGVEADHLEPIYPANIPEGYVLYEEKLEGGDTIFDIVYVNEAGEFIDWEQHLVSEADHFSVDSEYVKTKIVNVNGIELLIGYKEERYKRGVMEYDSYLILADATNLSDKELIALFQDLK